jgi:hypothetical protein
MALNLGFRALVGISIFSWLTYAAFWMEDIRRRGQVAFQSDPNYPVFRNVKAYGAVGRFPYHLQHKGADTIR